MSTISSSTSITTTEEIYSLEEVKANIETYETISRRGNAFATIMQKLMELEVTSQ